MLQSSSPPVPFCPFAVLWVEGPKTPRFVVLDQNVPQQVSEHDIGSHTMNHAHKTRGGRGFEHGGSSEIEDVYARQKGWQTVVSSNDIGEHTMNMHVEGRSSNTLDAGNIHKIHQRASMYKK